MDRFLLNFKSKIESLKKHEMSEDDWHSFLEYKKIHSINSNPEFYGNRKFRLAFTGAASLIAISLFALFFENHYDFFGKKLASDNRETTQKDTESFYSGNLSDTSVTESFNISIEKKMGYNPKITNISENKKIADSKSFPGTESEEFIKQNSNTFKNSSDKGKRNISSLLTQQKTIELKKDNRFQTSENPVYADIKNLGEYTDLKNYINNDDNKNTKNIASTNDLEKLKLKKFEITKEITNSISDTTIIYIIENHKNAIRKPRFIIGGTLAYIKPLKDRFDMQKLMAKKIGAEYYLSKKMRIGINYSISNNLSKIDKKEKNPHLNEINPHRPDIKVEELTMKTEHKKIGIETSYDFLSSKKLIGTIGLGIKHDISNDYNFRFKIRDNDEKSYFEEQENKFLIKRRNYIVPKISFEYQAMNNLRLKSQIEYEASVSDLAEKYLSFEAGIAFCF